jgi:PAS domain S-box-containing protein
MMNQSNNSNGVMEEMSPGEVVALPGSSLPGPDSNRETAGLVLVDPEAIKAAEQAAIEARDLAEAIIRTTPDPFLILDARLHIERANEAFFTTFKISEAEATGRTIFELDNGQWDIPQLRELLLNILPRHSFFNNFEITSTFGSVGKRSMLLNARTLRDTTGQPARILLGIQDISALQQLQTQKRDSELRYRRLFEAAKDGVLVIDPQSRKILDANPYMSDLLGYAHEDLLGKELYEIGLLKDEAASQLAFEFLQKTGFMRYDNLPLETRTGERREAEFVSNLYQEGEGTIIQCNIRDVTIRKKTERELSEKARLLDLSNDVIIVCGRNDKITWWNKGAEELYGWTGVEAIGKPMQSLQTEFPRPREEIIEELYRIGQFSGEVVQIARDGRRVPSLCRWVLDRSTDSILTSYTDITEQKQLADELRRVHTLLSDRAGQLEQAVTERTAELLATNKQLEAFAYTIAHDLRAPLRSMQGFSHMLLEEVSSLNEEGRDYAQRISTSAQFLDGLLTDLLTFSGVAQGRVDLAAVNLEKIIRQTLARLEKDLQQKKAQVEVEGLWPMVRGHEPTLGQVLTNLLTNAVKFVAPGVLPRVRLRAEERNDFVRIWVEDNGIGLATDHQTQIFRIFNRIHGEKYPGTGIGLAIVEKGIERMGGHFGVESVMGQGSRFWFELRKAELRKV